MATKRGLGAMGADARMRGYLGMGLRASVMAPVFKGEPQLRWVVERVFDTGKVWLVGSFDEACEGAAVDVFDANIAAAGGDSEHPRLAGVVEVRLALLLTDDSGTEHDRQPVESWWAS